MSANDSSDSARLERRLFMLRVAILPWLALVLGPLFLGMSGLLEVPALVILARGILLPAAVLHLFAFACRERPGLFAVAFWGGLLFLVTLGAGRDALRYVRSGDWRLVVWAGLLAFSQLTIVLAAARAWLLAPSSDGPVPYLTALGGGMAPFVIWSLFEPMHGWGGNRVSANESATIGDIRTMISAQATYQSANGGFYDVPECLVTPQRCIPGYAANQPSFLDPLLGQATVDKGGYRRLFHPGLPADPSALRTAKASASSLQSFAYVAVPLVVNSSGVRGFCGDSTGSLCFTRDGKAPAIANGQCTGCQPLY